MFLLDLWLFSPITLQLHIVAFVWYKYLCILVYVYCTALG